MNTITIEAFAQVKNVKPAQVRTAIRLQHLHKTLVPNADNNAFRIEIIFDDAARKWKPAKRGGNNAETNTNKKTWAARNYRHDAMGMFLLSGYWLDKSASRLNKRSF